MLILNSRLTNSITNQKKQRIWERITESINAVGVNRRRVSEVKEKWRNMQRKARRIIAERNLSLDSLEDQVPSSNSGSNSRVRMVEKPLGDTVETLATVAASSSTSSMVDDNHGVAISSENGSVQVGSNHRSDDKPSINSSLHVNNDSNGADVDNHLTIVIKEEIPDPVLKNDDLIISTAQNEPAEGDLADRTPLELVTPSIGCDTSSASRNAVGSYGFSSHKFNTNMVSTPEDNSPVYTTPQTQHWSSRLQVPPQVSSSKLHSLSNVSMSSNNIRVPSSLTSQRSYTTHGPSEKSNGNAVSSSLVLNNSIPDTLASLSSNSFVVRSHPLVTGGPSLTHLNQDNSVGPGVSHVKPSNRGTTSGGITQADLLQLQYEVLLADKKRILMQTKYYEMKMKRIEFELRGQTNSFF